MATLRLLPVPRRVTLTGDHVPDTALVTESTAAQTDRPAPAIPTVSQLIRLSVIIRPINAGNHRAI